MIATRYLPFVGRVMIGLPFAMSGLGKLAAYGKTTAMIAAVGLPVPPLAYAVAVIVELGGGLLLIAGYQTRSVALALALFSLAAAVSFHSNLNNNLSEIGQAVGSELRSCSGASPPESVKKLTESGSSQKLDLRDTRGQLQAFF